MHKNGLFTTGETSSMVNMPTETMLSYVRTFPEQARKARGRRFAGADVQALLLIRRMYQDRQYTGFKTTRPGKRPQLPKPYLTISTTPK